MQIVRVKWLFTLSLEIGDPLIQVKISCNVLIAKFALEVMLITLKENVQLGIKVFYVETALLTTRKLKISLVESAHLALGILFKHLLL
jgi:hypothetical protein